MRSGLKTRSNDEPQFSAGSVSPRKSTISSHIMSPPVCDGITGDPMCSVLDIPQALWCFQTDDNDENLRRRL